jgi:hypothetical protein
MTSTEPQEFPAFAEFTSLLRRRLWLWAILIVAITATITTTVIVDAETLYQAEALVVATELEVRVDAFPGTATAIFEGGTVAEVAAVAAATGISAEDLIPDVVDMSPIDGTAVVEVIATHPNPELAALYANATAAALVDELNRVGPGLGVFAVHSNARVPTDPVPNSMVEAIATGLIVGSVVVYGLIALISVITASRRSRAEQAAIAASPTSAVSGIGRGFQKRLAAVGINDIQTLAAASPDWLASTMTITPQLAENWVEQAIVLLGEDPRVDAVPDSTKTVDQVREYQVRE